MGKKRVQYFFAFLSPYAALADTRIDELVTSSGGELEAMPVVPPPMDEPTGIAKLITDFKREYMMEDCARWAQKLGVPWNPPPPARIDTTDAAAGWFHAREKGVEREYRNAVFRARFGEGRDITDHEVLGGCARAAGLDPADFTAGLRARRHHDHVAKALEQVVAAKVFGVPTFVVNGKRFWGNDRIDFMLQELRSI